MLFAGLDGYPGAPGAFLGRTIDLDTIQNLQQRLALAKTRPNTEGLPRYSEVSAFMSGPMELTIAASPDSTEARNAAFFPLPADLALVRRFPNGSGADEVVVDLPAQGFLTEVLEREIEDHFDQLRAIFDERNARRMHDLAAAAGPPLAQELFEEHAGYLLRALGEKLRNIVAAANAPSIKIGDLLGALLIPANGGASPASAVAAMTGRFFQYGLAFPKPSAWGTMSDKVPPDLRQLIDSGLRDTLPLYRYASLQLPLTRRSGAEYASSIGLRLVGAARWFTIKGAGGAGNEIFYALETSGSHSIDAVARSAANLPAVIAGLQFGSEIKQNRANPRRGSAPAFQRKLGSDAYLFGLPSELVGAAATQPANVRLEFREVSTGEPSQSLPKAEVLDASKFRLALAVEIGLKGISAPGQHALIDGVYELSGAREYERRLLDRVFDPPPAHGLAASSGARPGPENIAKVEMFLIDADSEGCTLLDGAVMIQTNLSADRKPPTFRAMTSGGETFSAPMDSPFFAELIHRGAIVNSGGFWLASKDAALKQRIAAAEQPTTGPEGPVKDVRALLVLTFDDRLADLTLANTLRVAVADLHPRQAERLVGLARDFHAGDTAVVISADGEAPSGPLPGTLPIRIAAPNTARLYPSLERSGAFGSTFEEHSAHAWRFEADVRAAADPVAELGSRFNLLEYAIADGGDGIFRTTRRADVLPVGHAEQGDAVQASNETSQNLTFDLTLPLIRMTMAAATNPYSIVGKRVAIRFTLRDIYGNSLPIDPKFATSGELSAIFKIPYLDALIGPSDLPHIKLSWSAPRPKRLAVSLVFTLQAMWSGLGDNQLSASGTDVARALPADFLAHGPAAAPAGAGEAWLGWAIAIADRCHAAAERYRLADLQIEDADSLAVQTTLGPGDPSADPYEPAVDTLLPADKTGLRTFYAAVITTLNHVETKIRALLVDPAAPWPALAPQEIPGGLEVALAQRQATLFIEARVALTIRRRGPAPDGRNLQAISLVPAAYVNSSSQEIPPVVDFAKAVIANLLPGYFGALGAPAAAGKPGEALWFVAELMLPTSAAPGDGAHPGCYALPPMRNGPASFTFENKKIWPAGGSLAELRPRVNLLDVDADLYAKRALQMIEDLLDPRAINSLIGSQSGKSALDAAVLAKEALAKPLASTVRRLLDSPSDPQAPAPLVASLADRFRRTLGAFYSVDAAITFQFTWSAAPPARPDDKPDSRMRPILYGKVSLQRDGDPPGGVALDVGSLALPGEPGAVSSPFHILYHSTSGHSVDSGRLSAFELTHIQRMPQPDLAALGSEKIARRYRETQWLKLIDKRSTPLANEPIDIPIVLRQLPERPRIGNHSFLPFMTSTDGESAKSLSDLAAARGWVFDLAWRWKAEPQDQLDIAIEYERPRLARNLGDRASRLGKPTRGISISPCRRSGRT